MSSFGKKTRNPGFEPGNHWVTCDICGFNIRSSDAKETWDNLVVCPEDWEPRQPQDFVRGVGEDQSPKGLTRTEPTDTFISVDYLPISSTVPDGTFTQD